MEISEVTFKYSCMRWLGAAPYGNPYDNRPYVILITRLLFYKAFLRPGTNLQKALYNLSSINSCCYEC